MHIDLSVKSAMGLAIPSDSDGSLSGLWLDGRMLAPWAHADAGMSNFDLNRTCDGLKFVGSFAPAEHGL